MKDDAHGYEDLVGPGETALVGVNGEYLWVQHAGEPRYVYRRVPPGKTPHPLVSSTVHEGALYSLIGIEEDHD